MFISTGGLPEGWAGCLFNYLPEKMTSIDPLRLTSYNRHLFMSALGVVSLTGPGKVQSQKQPYLQKKTLGKFIHGK